ncbi:nicotinamide mononucleotide transporter [Candidatus Pacearchaeota archaeon]|nr:nicotinamide mononucleotide transporter [Candidatus Pacearchaeota archaeon]
MIENIADLVGWIGNIAYITGSWCLARRNPIAAQSFNLIGGALYVAVGVLSEIPSLWVLSVFLTALNAYGIWNWRRRRKKR